MKTTWRFRSAFGELLLASRRAPSSAGSGEPLPASLAAFHLRELAADHRSRRELLALCHALFGCSVRLAADADVPRVVARLERALATGDLVATRTAPRRVVVPVDVGPAPLGWEEPPPAPDDFLQVLLFDSAGYPTPSAHGAAITFDAQLIGRGTVRDLRIISGAGGIPIIQPGTPTACTLTFHVADDRVPADADAAGPPRFDRLSPAHIRGALLDTKCLTRRQLATMPQGAVLDATNVFQLRRREAVALELEHFHDGSAVFLPGPAPGTVYREGVTHRPLGIDALRACLTLAQDYRPPQVVITGHGASLSQERANAVKALLVGDDASRSAWISVGVSTAVPDDILEVLRWAAGAFGWDCDPDAPNRALSSAIRLFKVHYNADVRAKRFQVVSPDAPLLEDGEIDPPTWGAIFDCYVRALRPTAADELPAWTKLPGLGVADETRGVGSNAGREKRIAPFVVLGTNGPGNAPITIAQYGSAPNGTGDPNLAFTALQKLNPQYHVGVDPEFVGQELNVPPEWASNLLAAPNGGYKVLRDRFPETPPIHDGPPPIAPTVLAIGCGAHHLRAPATNAEGRRTADRRAEVVLVDEEVTPVVACGPGSGVCTTRDCELYDPREFDLDYRENSQRIEEHWIKVLLFDSTGAPIPSVLEASPVRLSVRLQDGRRVPSSRDVPFSTGAAELPSFHSPDAKDCAVQVSGLYDASVVALPEAPPTAPPDTSVVRTLSRGDQPPEIRLVTRHELAALPPAPLDATTAFQLRRRRATVIPVGNFRDDGAIFLPGPTPAGADASHPRGIPVLRDVLRFVGDEHCVVIGHGAALAAERADNLAMLLSGDREAWAAACSRLATSADRQALREWVRRGALHQQLPEEEGWPMHVWRHVFDLIAHAVGAPPPHGARTHVVTTAGPSGRLSLWNVAQITWGYPARISDIVGANPGICDGAWQWTQPIASETFTLPEGWPPEPLRLQRYEVRAAATSTSTKWLPHVRSGGSCGTRHLEHPRPPRSAGKRAERVDIVVIEPPALVCHGDDCSKATCEIYDPSQVELQFRERMPLQPFVVTIPDRLATDAPPQTLVIADALGRQVGARGPDLHPSEDGKLTFTLDRDALPRPTRLFVASAQGAFPLGDAFDPLDLATGPLPPGFVRDAHPGEE